MKFSLYFLGNLTDEEIANVPKDNFDRSAGGNMKHCEEADGLMAPDKDTDGFVFNHLMLRIKDPKKTLNFYSKLMGMRLIKKFDFPTMKFSLYFLGNLTDEEIANVPKDNFDRSAWTFTQKGMLEFTHNWGSENDDKVKFHDGNAEPKGFGHICFSVPDIYAACKKFEENGVEFVKKPDDGSMKGLAFIKDPDGYWIEIVQSKKVANIVKEMGKI
jgi:lactoylglutathione lyase